MNAPTILHEAYTTLLKSACAVALVDWYRPGVCSTWSIKDVVTHMASYEQITVEVLTSFLRQEPTPLTDLLIIDNEQFDLEQVAQGRQLAPQVILDNYAVAHNIAQRRLAQIPPEMRQQNGTIPWYGNEHDLDDYLVHRYGHAREHAAQIDRFREAYNLAASSSK